MEEQKPPVHEEPVIVASTKKHSWSKKEKIALSVAGVIALVGLGFGGFTFYNQVILNAAGEESLGADATIDLPEATTSPYFKIVSTTQQSVDLAVNGDASNWPATNYDGTMPAQGWRIEMTDDSLGETGWKVVINEQQYISDGLKAINYNWNTSTKSADDPSLLQPDHTYYFRITKKTSLTDPAATWEQQGPSLAAQTTSYPSFGIAESGDQVKVSWTGTQNGQEIAALQGDNELTYGIARTQDVSKLIAGDEQWKQLYNPTVADDKQIAALNYLNSSNPSNIESITGGLVAGEGIINQPKSSVYYYAPVLYRISVQDSKMVTSIARVLSAPKMVATGTVSGQLLATVDVPTKSFPWNKLPENLKVNVALSDKNAPASAKYYADVQIKANNKFEGVGNTINFGSTKETVISTSPQQKSYSVEQNSGQQYQWGVGDYTLVTTIDRYDVTPSVEQVVETPITFTQAEPGINASFKSTTVKKGSKVSITVKNPLDPRGSQRPTGTVVIKNHRTGKTIKTFKLNWNTAKQTITFKATTKGSYMIDVVFTADKISVYDSSTKKNYTWPSYFQNKTINLPKLTVK